MGGAAGVSHLCQGSGCLGEFSCTRRHSATAASRSTSALFLIISFSFVSPALYLERYTLPPCGSLLDES